jgi:hypothetical protein
VVLVNGSTLLWRNCWRHAQSIPEGRDQNPVRSRKRSKELAIRRRGLCRTTCPERSIAWTHGRSADPTTSRPAGALSERCRGLGPGSREDYRIPKSPSNPRQSRDVGKALPGAVIAVDRGLGNAARRAKGRRVGNAGLFLHDARFPQ